jgi:HK97 family phage major capsid protein
MKRQFKFGLVAILALFAAAAFAGYPLTDYVPADVLAAVGGAMGGMPFMVGEVRTLTDQISAFEAKRASLVARQSEIQTKAIAEGRSKDEAEKEEFKQLTADIDSIDAELVDLRAMEKQAANATPVDGQPADVVKAGAAVRPGAERNEPEAQRFITVKANVEPGVAFARWAMAQFRAKGNLNDALSIIQHEKRWLDTTPQLVNVAKAAVAAGDTTTSGWASQLVYNENLAAEFIEYLRPMTVLGKLNLRKIPFNVRMGEQNGTATGYWVGQGAPIPVSKPGFTSQSLGISKCAGLVAIDEELARSSSPSAELLVRDDLAGVISTFMDVQFLDPNVAAVANTSPASITNGVTAVAATGTAAANLRTDLATLLQSMADNDIDMSQCVWIMTPAQALNIGLMLNSLGLPLYPEMSATGGKLLGLPVVTSNSANIPGSPQSGKMIILAAQREIFLADDGQITVDVSREASIQMLDNPTNTSTGSTTATTMVSMFQTHSLALRATRFVNWAKRRTTAVAYIKEAAYVA